MSHRPRSSSSGEPVSPVDGDGRNVSSQVSPVSEQSMSRGFEQSISRAFYPGAHPDSAYARLSAQRSGNFNIASETQYRPPSPPQHAAQHVRPQIAHSNSLRTTASATPGADNLGAAAVGGGISGIALGVANRTERQSGVEAMRPVDEHLRQEQQHYYDGHGYTDNPYVPPGPYSNQFAADPRSTRDSYNGFSNSASHLPLGGTGLVAAGSPAHGTPSMSTSNPSQLSVGEPYPRYPSGGLYDGPFHAYQTDPASINPDDIADDGDDDFVQVPQRRSGLFGKKPSPDAVAGGAAVGAATGGVLGAMNNFRQGSSTAYGPVPHSEGAHAEKNSPLTQHAVDAAAAKKRKRWLLTILVAVGIIAIIVGAIVGGILGSRNHDSSASDSEHDSSGNGSSDDPGTNINTAAGDIATNGLLDKDSPEIKDLMNNENLHRVFYGMDYTSWGVQYPLCEKYPPSPNNVTRDMAVLSQLTDTVRVYGTDCNQTEMVLDAIDRLELTDMKLWMGVWIDSNETTVDRQIKTLYKVIDGMKDKSLLQGVIVGNEVLYSGGFPDKATAQEKLADYMNSVRSELASKGVHVPVATSDLGDNWTPDLLEASDIVMANVHPFFGGLPVDEAAAWTTTFFETHDLSLTSGTKKGAIISEVGWPSGGGNDCGGDNIECPDKTSGSVAGIDEMNKFMDDWVCQALNNGTKYFWFEAFDEPWKVKFNKPGKAWEDKWGLLDSGRNLKPGLKIPNCGGKTVA